MRHNIGWMVEGFPEMKYLALHKLEKSARELLYGNRLFFPLRSVYQHVFDRQKLLVRRKGRDFYADFVCRGDLVFDIGANMGSYSETFCELGAKVVAVEPNPACCQNLHRLARICPVYVENCAAGDLPGKATLRICDCNGLSTLTDDWCEASQQSPLNREAKWTGTLEVEIITLDQLARRHGVPSFVKIDAEGFDDQVLRGMSFQPPALQFEFNRWLPTVAMRCFEAPALASGYEFNYVRGLEMRLACERWVGGDDLRSRLDTLTGNDWNGDVLARRIGYRHASTNA
jgi:FkbM family methyltransferase